MNEPNSLTTEAPGPGNRRLVARAIVLALLAALELPFLAFVYDPTSISTDPVWVRAHAVMREAVPASLFFLSAFALMAIPRRKALAQEWFAGAEGHRWRAPLVVNIALVAVMAVATVAFNRIDVADSGPPWGLYALWCAGVALAYLALLAAIAPFAWLRRFVETNRIAIALAAGAALAVEAAAVLSRQSWNILSEATFRISAWLLSLYEKDVMILPDQRVIGVDGFKVNIAAACSGYEGVGLVATFLLIYFWVFRRSLKFPNVLLVLPIAVAAIWLLNSLRIALLVSLGAHVSPQIAITGFHSQAGWMMFLVVTIAIMFTTHRLSFFHTRDASDSGGEWSGAAKLAAALLAPFLAMTAASILGAAFSAEGHYWVYGLRVAALLLAIFAFWRVYAALDWRTGLLPWLLGLLVGVLWIATDPGRGEEAPLGAWLAALPPASFALWISMRLLGTIFLVPLAEELAFRGYLHRKLIAEDFDKVSEAAFSWKAFLVSTALFGVLHERWLAGALAGAVFAFALYRSGKLSGAIVAHMAANAIIAFWAIAFEQWSLF